jgi:hypothetical protein
MALSAHSEEGHAVDPPLYLPDYTGDEPDENPRPHLTLIQGGRTD